MVKIKNEKEVTAFLKLRRGNLREPDLQGFQNLEGLISQQFSNFFNAYTKAYNKRYERKGSLFIPNFKRKVVSNDTYLTQLIGYIHLNPIKHGFCKHFLDWQYSSIHSYLSLKNTKINTVYLDNWFGNRENMLKFHQELSIESNLL